MSSSPPTTLASAVRERASRAPDGLAVIDSARRLTWAELARESEALADGIEGLGSPSPVLLLLPQTASAVALVTAASMARVDAIAIAEFHGVDGARAFLERLDGAALLRPSAEGGFDVLATRARAATDRSDEPALCLLTSGSTGRPKAVRHTWATLSAGATPSAHLEGVGWLAAYPLPQFAGMQVFAQAVNCGSTLVLTIDFSPAETLRALTENDVPYMSCTPSFARQLLLAFAPDDWARTGLRHISMGGEIIDQPLLDGLRAALPDVRITHIYGASEVGTLFWVRDGLAGIPAESLDGERAKLVDGELVVKRSARAGLGYHGGPSRSDAWLATGDLMEIRGDRAFFVGRRDDVINVAGFKVYPAAVSAVVRELPGVLDVSIVGQESSVAGNLVKAVVYADPGVDTGALRVAIIRLCRERLAPQMVPRLFEFVEGLRLSGAQKLARGSIT